MEQIQKAFLLVGTLNLTSIYFNKDTNVQDGDVYDFIVVGAGSAGCIVANRLSEVKNQKILLIEAGGDPPLASEYPGLSTYMKHSAVDWNFTTVNDGYSSQCMSNGRLSFSQGKMLGGSSSINGMIYNRGNPYDYLKWAEAAQDPSWKWENILPYFKKIENLIDVRILNSPYKKFHGTNGNIQLKRYYTKKYAESFESYIEIGENIVLDATANIFKGITEPLTTIDFNGLRQSTANTYLKTAVHRDNLDIMKNTLVTKILFNQNMQAIGIEVIDKNNRKIYIKAKKEVIVCAGAINSPKLLMLSGIGPKHHLRSNDIPVLVDLPVGQGLQDHVSNMIFYKMEKINENVPLSNNIREFSPKRYTGFIALNKSQIHPDFQIIGLELDCNSLFEICISNGYQEHYCRSMYEEVKGHKILSLGTQIYNPKSRGKILLQNKDPKQQPNIYTGYYTSSHDLDDHVKYVRYLLKLEETTYFKNTNAKLIVPKFKPCLDFEFKSKEFWKCHLLCGAFYAVHLSGTCAIGAVVDSNLRVFGVKNLRVVDASIMPFVPGANTNGPTLMIAEKASDIIKEDYKHMYLNTGISYEAAT